MNWNHNSHYHNMLLKKMPTERSKVLDVGCGSGLFTQELAKHFDEVTSIDNSKEMIDSCKANTNNLSNTKVIHGDVLKFPLEDNSYNMICAIASLHHLPNQLALKKFKSLLKPKGILAILGLYKEDGLEDQLLGIGSVIYSKSLALFRGKQGDSINMPIVDPIESYGQIKAVVEDTLPNAIIQKHLLWRYSIIWTKPNKKQI